MRQRRAILPRVFRNAIFYSQTTLYKRKEDRGYSASFPLVGRLSGWWLSAFAFIRPLQRAALSGIICIRLCCITMLWLEVAATKTLFTWMARTKHTGWKHNTQRHLYQYRERFLVPVRNPNKKLSLFQLFFFGCQIHEKYLFTEIDRRLFAGCIYVTTKHSVYHRARRCRKIKGAFSRPPCLRQ